MQMQPDFDKAHEIYFRLGIIYKQQQKYNQSLEVRTRRWSRRRLSTELSEILTVYHSASSTLLTRRRHP
jgi:hypothetical protein